MRPLLVLVSGAPGSGKTTLARRLAIRLGIPHLNRDSFYNGIAMTEGSMPSPVRNAEVLYATSAQMLSSGVSLIMDMTTYRGVTEDHLRRVVLPVAEAVVVHCRTPVALDRFRTRQALRFGADTDTHRRGVAQAEEAQPLVVDPPELDVPRLGVETTFGYQPGLEGIVEFILEHASGSEWVARHLEPEPTVAQELRRLADSLRVVADTGLRWSSEAPYDQARYHHVRRLAAEVFALADTRGAEEVEQEVFSRLTHLTPAPVVDAAVVDDSERVLLIRRADDGLWAMPGGAFDMGETPSEGAVRETLEETGHLVEPVELVGVYDSRRCGTRSSLQLFHFVFLCRPVSVGEPTTPHEVTDLGWFGEGELPPLSPGHAIRVPDAFRFLRDRRAIFDRPSSSSAAPDR